MSSSTYKFHLVVLCGVEPDFDLRLAPGPFAFPCLPTKLAARGYHTVYFSSAGRDMMGWVSFVDGLGFETYFGFQDMPTDGFERANMWSYEDDIMLGPSEEWLMQHGADPFVAAYKANTPHHDYRAPTRYGRHTFTAEPEHNRYLNAVGYVDHFVANLIVQYRRLGLAENTIFVLVGDHGEGFDEHTPRQHNANPYETVVRIPLMIYGPGFLAPRRVGGLVSQLDVTPTLLELLGMSTRPHTLRGTSLIHQDPTRKTVNTTCVYVFTCATTIEADLKYVHYFGEAADELFSLKEDPFERNNLLYERPKRAAELRAHTLEWYLMGRSGPRNLDSGLSGISIVFQAAVPKPVVPKYTTSGVRRPSEL